MVPFENVVTGGGSLCKRNAMQLIDNEIYSSKVYISVVYFGFFKVLDKQINGEPPL